jgi:hypothetical protein
MFDLDKDPYETKNLIADPAYAELRRKLEAEFVRLAESAGCDLSQPVPKQEPAPEKKKGKRK